MFTCIAPAWQRGGRGRGGRGHVTGSQLRYLFDDEQLYYENNVAAGGNDDADGNDRGMNINDGGDDRGMNNDEGEQQVEEEMGEAWERMTKKRKSQMSDDELRTYFDSQLRGVGECPNPSCNCVAIIADRVRRQVLMLVQCENKV